MGLVISVFVSGPHYGATLLRVYEQREERRKYALFSVGLTLVVAGLTSAALYEIWLGSALLTLYLTWSPWHYAGQNYGIALLLLRRRGVQISPSSKRLLYASFVLSTLLALLRLHGDVPNLSYALELAGASETYRMLPLGIPKALSTYAILATAAAYALCLILVAWSFGRHARWRDLMPAALLVASQGLWFSLPGFVLGATSYRFAGSALALTASWIAAAHALQYLWVTTYFARREEPSLRVGTYLVKATCAGAAVIFVPALFFSPALLGTLPFDAGLATLPFAAMNVHHFILDGAIWKLRDGRVARVLLRSDAHSVAPTESERRGGLRPLLLGAGALGVVVSFVEPQLHRAIADPTRDLEAKRSAARRLGWVGRPSANAHIRVGHLLAEGGDEQAALEEFQRSVSLVPNQDVWTNIGVIHERAGRLEEALVAYATALDQGEAPRALFRTASVSFALADRKQSKSRVAEYRARATLHLERLLAVAPAHLAGVRKLAEVYMENGRMDRALGIVKAALAASNDTGVRAKLRLELRTLRDHAREAGSGSRD